MKLDLSEIARSVGMRAAHDVDEPCCPKSLDLACVSPIKGRLEMANTGSLVLVKGKIKTDVRLACSRCLTDLVLPVEAQVDEQFRVVQVGDAMVLMPEEEGEAASELVSDNALDLAELIRQNLLVAIPIQPLCTPDCKGLCPTCGRNLNIEQCTCQTEARESPFQALADLLEQE